MTTPASYTDHVWLKLPNCEQFVVTTHPVGVSLGIAGYVHAMDGHGFSLHFTQEHIPILYELVKALENLDAKDEQGEE